jgi:hypothetical protein
VSASRSADAVSIKSIMERAPTINPNLGTGRGGCHSNVRPEGKGENISRGDEEKNSHDHQYCCATGAHRLNLSAKFENAVDLANAHRLPALALLRHRCGRAQNGRYGVRQMEAARPDACIPSRALAGAHAEMRPCREPDRRLQA